MKRNLLSLPVDSRFGADELRTVARLIRDLDADKPD